MAKINKASKAKKNTSKDTTQKKSKKWIYIISSLIAVLIIGFIAAGPIMSDVEQSKYTMILKNEGVEFRLYNPRIAAEVTVEGERREAIQSGFRILADYIFGNNTSQKQIEMTSPVTQTETVLSEEIAMTAPVTQIKKGNAWVIRFYLPPSYTLKTLPKPINEKISFIQLPAEKYLALSFSGSYSSRNLEKHRKQLLAYAKKSKANFVEPVHYAFYNPPWTIPPLRTIEVLYKIK